MAMTLRLPEQIDHALAERAKREGRSKQELAIDAIRRDNERAGLSVETVLDELVTEHQDILDRLA